MSGNAHAQIGNASIAGDKVSLLEKAGYGLGDFTTSLIFTAIGSFLSFFYTDVVGIAAATVGTLMFITRFIDGVADIGMGIIVDRTKSKHGKARPWLLWMAIPFGASVILLFTAPDLGPTGAVIYAYVTYLVVNLIYTAINIPYGVLNSLMTQDPYERSVLNIFRMTSAFIGAILITFLTMPLVNAFGGGKIGWMLTFAIFGVITPFIYFFTFKTTKEQIKPAVVKQDIPLKKGLRALFRNKYWALLVVFFVLVYLSSGMSNALNVYYAQYILNDAALVGTLGLAGLIPILIGMPLSAPIIKRFGKRNASLAGLVLSVVGSLILLIDPENFTVILAGTVVKSFALAPVVATLFAMLADTVDYGEWKTGARTEGLVYSAGSFGSKVGSGLGGAVVGWALASGGYVGTAKVQSASAIFAIKFMYLYAPILLSVLMIVILAFYTLDKKYPEIIRELNEVKSV